MSAESVYNALREVIATESEADEDLTMFELIGVVRIIESELVDAFLVPDDDDDSSLS